MQRQLTVAAAAAIMLASLGQAPVAQEFEKKNHNYSAFAITLKHDVTSTAANRFYCPGEVDYVISKYGSAMLVYNPTHLRWNVLANS